VTLNRFLPIAAICLLTLVIGCSQTQQTGPSFTLYAVQNSTGAAGSSDEQRALTTIRRGHSPIESFHRQYRLAFEYLRD